MKKIAVIPCPVKDADYTFAKKAIEILLSSGADVIYPVGTVADIEGAKAVDGDTIYETCDAAVVFGGDGSLIGQALRAAKYEKALLGCNMGKVGYLAEVELDELEELTKLLTDEFNVEDRMVLEVTDDSGVYCALNDVVISRGAEARIAEIALLVDGHEIGVYRSDGLILATPTGSTAYSMSAGGSVIDPALSCIAATPICPHQFGAKPMVFSASTVLSVENRCSDKRPLAISLDGKVTGELTYGRAFHVTKAALKCRFIRIKQRVFCNMLKKIKEY